jgi:type IV pilus assembly protein PilV
MFVNSPNFGLHSGQEGFSLVEVLVSVLILGIGLLGLAALQVRGLRTSQMSMQRSVATQLAYDIADRMRANSKGVEAGYYNNKTAGTNADACESASCTAEDMAKYDLKRWNDDLARKLPGGKGVACLDDSPNDGASGDLKCDGSASGLYAIKVFWNEQVESATTAGITENRESRFVTTLQP